MKSTTTTALAIGIADNFSRFESRLAALREDINMITSLCETYRREKGWSRMGQSSRTHDNYRSAILRLHDDLELKAFDWHELLSLTADKSDIEAIGGGDDKD